MASNIDTSKPVYGNPTTQSVRDNFEIAQVEITALQNLISPGPFLPLNGDERMTGFFELYNHPRSNFEPATKQYVDDLAFGSTGAVSEAPLDGMFYARGGGDGTVLPVVNNDWVTNPLFSALSIGPDAATPRFGLSTDATFNFYTLTTAGGNQLRFNRGTNLLEFIIKGAVNAGFSDTAITLNRPVTITGDTVVNYSVPATNFSLAPKSYVDGIINASGGPYLRLAGGTMSAAISFGGMTAPGGSADLSKHLQLHTAGYGLNVTGGRLNYVTGGSHVFVSSTGVDIVNISPPGLTMSANKNLILAQDPTSALHAVTKQYADLKLPLTGGQLSGPLTIQYNSIITDAHLNLQPPSSSANSLESKFRFFGTFATGADLGARLTASFRSGYSTGGWGTEYLDVWLNNGAANDAVSDANQKQIIRFTKDDVLSYVGISITSALGATNYDVTKHIALYGATYGFSITSNRLNYIAPGVAAHSFLVGNVDKVLINSTGITMPASTAITLAADPTAAMQAVTKQYVDTNNGLYLPLAGGTLTGGLAFQTPVASAVDDLSKQISLSAGGYGFSITGGRLNLVAPGTIVFYVAGADRVVFYAGQIASTVPIVLPADPTANLHAVTKQYVDANDAMDLPLTGGTLSGGLSFGSAIAGSGNDLSRHIALYSSIFGFSVTGSRINYVVPGTNFHAFRSGNVDRLLISDGGITMSAGTAVTLAADPTANLHATTKQYVDTNNAKYLLLTGGTVTGNLVVKNFTFFEMGTTYGTATASGNSSRVIMNAAMGTGPGFAFKIANVTRWNVILNNGAESGNDAGGDICFYAYHDDGSFIGTPINIRRSDGYTQFSSTIKVGRDPTIAMEVATKQYVDTNNAKYLLLTGGTLTNFLTLNAAPTSNLHAATKQYVDDLIVAGQSGVATFNGRNGAVTLIKGDVDSAGGPYMPSSGGAFTGGINFGNILGANNYDTTKHV